MLAAFATRSLICAASTLRRFRPNARFSATVMCGYSAYDWNTIAMSRSIAGTSLTTRPSMLISPPVIDSSPAIIRKVVDLPQPDGPSSTMNSPSATVNETSSTDGAAAPA